MANSDGFEDFPATGGDPEVDDLADRFVEMCAMQWTKKFNLPPDRLWCAMILHASLSLAARTDAKTVVHDLRDLAKKIEEGGAIGQFRPGGKIH
jgi:hypothetical protein